MYAEYIDSGDEQEVTYTLPEFSYLPFTSFEFLERVSFRYTGTMSYGAVYAEKSNRNGIVEGPEECDDYNFDDEDGCSVCGEIEANYICEGNPSSCSKFDSESEDVGVSVASASMATNALMLASSLLKGTMGASLWVNFEANEIIYTSMFISP